MADLAGEAARILGLGGQAGTLVRRAGLVHDLGRLGVSNAINKEIGERLVISRKTASHHVEHIYAKTGATNRALASLFAASHGLTGGSPGRDSR